MYFACSNCCEYTCFFSEKIHSEMYVVVWTICLTITAIFLILCLNSSGCIVLKLICERVLLWNIVTCWGMFICYQHHSTHSGFLSSTHCLKHSDSIWLWSVRLLNWRSDFICLMRPQTPNYFPCLQRLQRTDNLISYSLSSISNYL